MTPATFDLANLLEYDDFFTNDEKQKYICSYASEMQTEGKPLPDLLISYHNSVIHRMICFASAWSSPDRSSMQSKRSGAIQRAITAISAIERDCNAYFAKFEAEYSQLADALQTIKDSLDT